MKNKMALLALATTAWLATTANTPGPRSIENPFIESANTMTLDIAKVELSDTATVLYTDPYFRPHTGSKSVQSLTCKPTARNMP